METQNSNIGQDDEQIWTLGSEFFIWAGGYWFWGQKKRQIGDKIFFQYFFPNLLV